MAEVIVEDLEVVERVIKGLIAVVDDFCNFCFLGFFFKHAGVDENKRVW